MNRKSTEPTPVGQLFASKLFGISPELSRNVPGTISELSRNGSVQISRNSGKFRDSKAVFSEDINTEPLIAVFPFITSECFAETMNRYRIHVANQNKKIKELNLSVKEHNNKVKLNIENGIDEIQATFIKLFLKKHSAIVSAKEYNALADEFNQDRGLLIEKKRFRTGKYGDELIFQNMLHDYALQLQQYTSEYMKLRIHEPSAIKKFKLQTYSIVNNQRNGQKAIDVCSQTIRNRRAVLEELGVLIEYKFKGYTEDKKTKTKQYRPVEHTINRDILVVFDAKTQKFVSAENQPLTSQKAKDFQYRKESTRSIKNNIKKRVNGQADLLRLGTPSAELPNCFLQEHSVARKDSYQTEAAESVKISTKNLEKTILHPAELARKLSEGEFNNYSPIDIRYLHREAMYGTLTLDEMNQVVVQEFFKTAAKYYKNHTVYVGSWKKPIVEWTEKRFRFSNGDGKHLCNKQLMVDLLEQYRWRLKNSENFYRKTGIKRLFPSDYFDFNRKTKSEIGFEYTEIAWKRHLEYLQREPELKKRAKRKLEKRLTNNSAAKKYDLILKRFFNNRVSYEQLYDYVNNNLPKNFMEKLSEVVMKTASKYQC